MQAKKRAKSVKFGSKTQEPKTTPHHEPVAAHHSKTEPVKEKIYTPVEEPVDTSAEKADELPNNGLNSFQPEPDAPVIVSRPEPHKQSTAPQQDIAEIPENQPDDASPAPTEDIQKPASDIHHNLPDPSEYASQDPQDSPTVLDESSYPPLGGDTYIVEKEIKKNMLGYFIVIAIIAFLIGLASMAGANYFLKDIKIPDKIPYLNDLMATPTPTPKPTLTPTPTEKKINLSAYDIEIRNGSGITGAAATLKDSLTSSGFKIITTGNADNSEYTDTIIQASKNIDPDYLSKLKDSLKKIYSLGTNADIPAAYTGQADLIIIIGSEKAL